MKIGVIVESFCEELHTALQSAAKMGIQGVQIYACHSSHKSLIEMSSAERADLLKYIKDLGMEVSSICGDLGGHGFQDKEGNAKRIELSKQIIDACCELDTKVMTTHVGGVPTKDESPVYQEMVRVAKVVGEYASANGVTLAIETGPETSAVLKNFLDSLGSRGVAVNLDPANLVMVSGDDPVQAVHNLKDYIVHTHAKDGVMLHRGNPEYIYGVVHPVPQEFQGIQYFAEVPLGTGGVHFPTYLQALEDIGYNGFLTIERECGDNPRGDIQTAIDHLTGIMGK